MTYKPNDVTDSGIRVLRSSNINEDSFIENDDDVFVKESAVNISSVKDGDILITSANGSNRLVGKHAIIFKAGQAVHGGFMLIASAYGNPYLENQVIRVPSEAEQLRIGQFFQSLDQTITLHQRAPNDAQSRLPIQTGGAIFTKQGYCLLSSGFNSLRISSLNSLLI